MLIRLMLARLRSRAGDTIRGALGISPHSTVELLDLVREVLLADPAPQLERRRHLLLLGREVAGEDGEALDLLEARAVCVYGLHDLLDQRMHSLVLCQSREIAVEALLVRPRL